MRSVGVDSNPNPHDVYFVFYLSYKSTCNFFRHKVVEGTNTRYVAVFGLLAVILSRRG